MPVTEIGDGENSVYEHKYTSLSIDMGFQDDTIEMSNVGIYAKENLEHVDKFALPDHLESLVRELSVALLPRCRWAG